MNDRTARPGRLWRSLGRWTAPDAEIEAERLRARAQGAGCRAISDVGDREQAQVRGIVHTVTLQPRAGTPALEAELYDGSALLTLVWLGRRRIAGVDCGRRMIVHGRVTTMDGHRVMYNPRYQLLPEGTA